MVKGKVETQLIEAHERILQGWSQHRSVIEHENGNYSYCIVGSLPGCMGDAYRILLDIVSSDHPNSHMRLTLWNDTPGRTLQEVSDLFMDAIDIARLENL